MSAVHSVWFVASEYLRLRNKGYSPPFTSWGAGVEVQEDESDFAIGVSITQQSLRATPYPNDMFKREHEPDHLQE